MKELHYQLAEYPLHATRRSSPEPYFFFINGEQEVHSQQTKQNKNKIALKKLQPSNKKVTEIPLKASIVEAQRKARKITLYSIA